MQTVTPDTASASYEYNGEKYYFCSKSCLQKFREMPESYLKPTKAATFAADDNGDSYKPLIAIILLISISTAALAIRDLQLGVFALDNTIRYFMTGFSLFLQDSSSST